MSDFKYLVHLTAPVTTSFKADNHRGEPRYERNAVDALVTAGKTVHSTTYIWQSALPRPANLYDMRLDWMKESIQVSYGVAHEIYTGHYPAEANPKYRVVQYWDGPTNETKDSFLKYHREDPGSIVATTSFKSWHYLSRLEMILGRENVEWMYGPMVPEVFEDHDSFNQPCLFWAYRNFCDYVKNDPLGMRALFAMVGDYLRQNHDLKLVILVHGSDVPPKNLKTWFLDFSFATSLKPQSDRIDVVTGLHWSEMLDLFSKTRLVISPAGLLGGPPFEAASYGVPVVLSNEVNPFIDSNRNALFSGVLSAPQGISREFLSHLNRLYGDSDFYHQLGNAARAFVKQHATYEAYIRGLEGIAVKRGWS